MKKSINQLSNLIADKITKDNTQQIAQEIWWILVRQKQYGRLGQLIDQVEKKLAEKNGKMMAVLVSPTQPTDKNIEEIKEKLKASFGKEVDLKVKIDKNLLGGFKVITDDYTIDLSYKTKLNQLKLKLAGVYE